MPTKRKPSRRTKTPALELPPDLMAALLETAEREKTTPAELVARAVFGLRHPPAYCFETLDEFNGSPGLSFLWDLEDAGNRAAWWIRQGLSSAFCESMIGGDAVAMAAKCPDAAELLDYLPGPVRDELLSIPDAPWPDYVRRSRVA